MATAGVLLRPLITGLVLSGVLAAAFAAKRLPDWPPLVIVGVVVSLLALRGLLALPRALVAA